MHTSRIRLAALLLLVLVGVTGAWYAIGPRSQAAPNVHGQGRALLDAVVSEVKSTYIKRDINEEQLYAAGAKGVLESVGPACAKTVEDPSPAAAGAKARLFGLVERAGERCPAVQRNPQRLYLAAAKTMLESLGDQYTRLMEPEAFRMFIQDTQGFFFGIGIFIDVRDDYPIVVQPIPNTPASRAGLRAGDRIIMVEGISMKDIALQEAVTRIRGKEGTPVRLRIRRGDNEFDVSIVRARISIAAAEGPENLDAATRAALARERIGYVKLVTFNHERADQEFDRLVAQARRAGARALILDLRNNGGGLLEQSMKIASRFLPNGQPILHVYNRSGQRDTERAVRASKVNLPTVVLVNEFSASASEIVAGALMDHKVATVVGVRTFGKNLIQSIVDLPMGAGAAITSAKWLTPNETDISAKGLVPEVLVGEVEEVMRERLKGRPTTEIDKRVEEMKAEQFKRAVEILKRKIQRGSITRLAA